MFPNIISLFLAAMIILNIGHILLLLFTIRQCRKGHDLCDKTKTNIFWRFIYFWFFTSRQWPFIFVTFAFFGRPYRIFRRFLVVRISQLTKLWSTNIRALKMRNVWWGSRGFPYGSQGRCQSTMIACTTNNKKYRVAIILNRDVIQS